LLSSKFVVDLYEANDYLGGHTNTVDITVSGMDLKVDTGFMVCNYRTYHHFTRMLEHLGVDLQPSTMSFSVQCEDDNLEWAGTNINTVFAQRRNVLSPRFLRMLFDIWRLSGSVDRLIDDHSINEISLEQLLDREGLSQGFREWYLVPMGAAIWSMPPEKMMEFPAHAFLRFCDNHGLIRLRQKPQWYSVAGGARSYVKQLVKGISGDILKAKPVEKVRRDNGEVEVILDGAREGRRYDAAVLACHADDSLLLLEKPSEPEEALLKSFPYQMNDAYLHTDASFLPSRPRAVSSWNYLDPSSGQENILSVTYNLNLLQDLGCPSVIMVTLNPPREPAQDRVLEKLSYAHPMMTRESVGSQDRIGEIQGTNNTWYAGAWQRYGFHEDGLLSAINVARDFGIQPPWSDASVS
jgi:predicted NAD/FAD-binding protein